MSTRMLLVAASIPLAGCVTSRMPMIAPAPKPVVVEAAATEPYRWLAPANEGTCRRVPTYGLGGRPGPRPVSRMAAAFRVP